MPLRYIAIPAPVQFRNPDTDEPVDGPDGQLTWEKFMRAISYNPLWVENAQAFKAQLAVFTAWDKAKAERDIGRVLVIADEDWQVLKKCIEKPNPVGFGWSPALARQLVPFMDAVLEAGTKVPVRTDPEVKAEVKAETEPKLEPITPQAS